MQVNKYNAIFPVIFRQKQGLLQLLALAVLAALLTALLPWPVKLLVDYALVERSANTTSDIGYLRNFTAAQLVALAAATSLMLFAASSAATVASSWLWSKTGQSMVVDLSLKLFDRLQHLSRLYHTRHPIADSLSRLTVDTWCVFSIAQALLITPVQNLLTLAVVSVIAWQLDPFLTLLSLALAPVLALSTLLFGKRLKHHATNMREAQSAIMSFVHQTLGAIPLVKAFHHEKLNQQRFQELSGSAINATRRNTLVDNSFKLFNGVVLSAGLAIVLFFGSQRVIEGSITIGSLLVFMGYLRTLQGEAESLLLTYANLKTAEASLARVMEIIDAPEDINDAESARLLPRSSKARTLDIRFENVSFGYEPERPIIKDVTLNIPAGKTVALVGGSGSGKSTLASLIPRFFDIDAGQILVGNKPVQDIALQSLRERISLVLQDPYLLPLTIAENIAYGKPEASREEIIQAATTANASAFIRKLPQGYDTVLGERGVTLSGGQRQRLSIARALLKDAPILILDEPTSALDNRTESLFFSALTELIKGRTTIIVAHRLSTIRKADLIVVLDDGRISEQGSHEELLTNNGLYADMYRIQHPEEFNVEENKAA